MEKLVWRDAAPRRNDWVKAAQETDWQEIARRLERADALRQAETDADAMGLSGVQRSRYIAARMQECEREIEQAVTQHIGNVLDVLRWVYVACPSCASEQWAKVEKGLLGDELTGQFCAGCGRWLDDRTWRPAVEAAVHAPPDEDDNIEDEEQDEEGDDADVG